VESFLDRAVATKANRIAVLDGLNRLDDIERGFDLNESSLNRLGGWLSEFGAWKTDSGLKPADRNRIGSSLEMIQNKLGRKDDLSPELAKIASELERWQATKGRTAKTIVLRRQPEDPEQITPDSISAFSNLFANLSGLWQEKTQSKGHILSVLDDLLKSAELQNNRQALLLAGFVIYYLRLEGYRVEPYVKRLRKAEQDQSEQIRRGGN
jgi:hypothetical protein